MTRLLLSLPLLLAVFLSPDLALIVLLTVLGIPGVLLLDSSLRRNTVLGVSFLLGCGIAHLLLLAMSALSIRWTRDSLQLGFVIVYAGTATLLLWRRRRESVFPTSEESPSPVSVLLHLATVGLVLVYSRYAVSLAQGSWERWTPLWRRDYWGIWGLKAKLFIDAKAIDWAPLEQPLHWSVHPDYPLLVPLLLDVVAIFRGGLNPIAIGSIYTAFAVALLLILRDLWSEELQRRVAAALSTLLMAPAVLSIYVGLAEGPLIAYAGAGLLLLRRDLRSGGPGRITPLLLGFAALTKNEGLGLLVAVLLVMLLRPELRRRARRLWPGFALAGLWLLLRIQHGLSTDLFENLSPGTMAGRLLDPARWAQAFSVPSLENPLFWLALTLALALLTPEAARREFLLLGVVGIQLLFFAASYLISPHDLGWHVTSSWARLLAQIAVPLSFVALLVLWREIEQKAEADPTPAPATGTPL